jgi:hypothetical protein
MRKVRFLRYTQDTISLMITENSFLMRSSKGGGSARNGCNVVLAVLATWGRFHITTEWTIERAGFDHDIAPLLLLYSYIILRNQTEKTALRF